MGRCALLLVLLQGHSTVSLDDEWKGPPRQRLAISSLACDDGQQEESECADGRWLFAPVAGERASDDTCTKLLDRFANMCV
jgi:hypothetical protein